MERKRKNIEQQNIEQQNIELHCKKCNQRLMDYTLYNNDELIAVQGITIKCSRCKRILILKKYTEGILRKYACNHVFRV